MFFKLDELILLVIGDWGVVYLKRNSDREKIRQSVILTVFTFAFLDQSFVFNIVVTSFAIEPGTVELKQKINNTILESSRKFTIKSAKLN